MTTMSSLVSVPNPSMAESPLGFGEGINECAMFSAALDSAVLAESGHSSCDEQSSAAARDADDASEVPEKSTVDLGVRRSSRMGRLRVNERVSGGRCPSSSSFAERDKAESPPSAAAGKLCLQITGLTGNFRPP